MTKEEISTSLDSMLENPKAKTFLNHLVRAYMPHTNVKYLIEKPKGDFKCVLTRDTLLSGQDMIIEGKLTDTKNDFVKFLDTIFDEKVFIPSGSMVDLINTKKLGITGKDTNTYMSFAAYQEFIAWVITKALKGDKHINWLLGSIRRASLIDRAERIQDSEVQAKVENYKKTENKVSSFTLADSSDVLTKLKAAMVASGN